METLKALLNSYARPFLVKYAIRVVGYGAVALTAKLNIDAPSASWQSETANWLVTVLIAAATMAIDYWQHKKDLAQKPPKP